MSRWRNADEGGGRKKREGTAERAGKSGTVDSESVTRCCRGTINRYGQLLEPTSRVRF
jgi:hypothetical protein